VSLSEFEMKKALKITGITIGALLVLVMAAAVIIPVAFREKIKEKVETGLNDNLRAKVSFGDYRLSILKAFPDASFSLEDLTVEGTEEFEGDTLAAIKSVSITVNLLSLFGNSGYEVKSILIDKPAVNAIVTVEGHANWDIIKETEGEPAVEQQPESITSEEEGSPALNLMLRKFRIAGGGIRYTDQSSDMSVDINNLDFILSGNMKGSETRLDLDLETSGVNFTMEKVSWLTDATIGFTAGIDAQLDSMRFLLRDNTLKINDITLNFSGMTSMPGDNIEFDMIFSAPATSFKSLLSLVPAFYMEGYDDLAASGTVALDGTVKGIYSSADSILPDVALNLEVRDGIISYPLLPEKITSINIKGSLVTDGTEMDNTVAEIDRFHFELAGNPFDMNLRLSTPISDPSVTAAARGKIDLAKLQQALPLDSITLNGLLDISVDLAGRMSMIENSEYDKFLASGRLRITDMRVKMEDMPDFRIDNAAFTFTPAFAELTDMKAAMGKGSDFALSGRLGNYIPYLFSDATINGNLTLRSEKIDLNELLDIVPADTVETDQAPMEVVRIPGNIDFTFDAYAGKLTYGRISAGDVRGKIIVRDGVVTVRETGMKAMGGSMAINAVYDTRDTLKPVIEADMQINTVNIRETFDAFNTVRQLMPAASGLGGSVSSKIEFRSTLGKGMMPLLNTLSGSGQVSTESVQVLESGTFDRMKGILKVDPAYTNIIKDLKATFVIDNGRLWVKPFDAKLGKIRLNVSGDQGLDQTLNYTVKTEIPSAELGDAAGALMNSISSQAAAMGLGAGTPEMIKVNLSIGGTVGNPIIKPSFGGGSATTVAAAVADTVKQEVISRVGDAARQQADRILNEADEKARLIREEAARAGETIRTEADQRGKKLIKDAEAKGPIAVAAARKAAETLNREADKKAAQLVSEANTKADGILTEARTKADELLK
jgi:hypothetical protein